MQTRWNSKLWTKLMDISPDFIFISRIDTFEFVEVSKRACEVYGYSRKEFLKMQVFDIEVDAPLVSEIQKLYKNTPIRKVIEVFGHNRCRDGVAFPVHVRFMKIDKNFAMANVRDISIVEDQTDLKVLRNRLVSTRTKEVLLNNNLSKREVDVLNLLGKGKSTSQIATKLKINKKTISTYRSRLILKLGLENGVALTQYAASIR